MKSTPTPTMKHRAGSFIRRFTSRPLVRGSALKVTPLMKTVALVAGFSMCIPHQYTARATGIPVIDAAAIAELTSILTLTAQINSSDATTATQTTEMNLIKTSRQAIAYALNAIEVLQDFQSLVDSSPTGEMAEMAASYLNGGGQATAAATAYINQQPKFNELSYDGTAFRGQNAEHIDSIVGVNGLPIAADRTVPAMLMTIPTSAHNSITGLKEKYQNSQGGRVLAQATDRITRSPVKASANMVDDGVFVRPASAVDNFYIANVQNGTPSTVMNYYGAVDGMGAKGYTYNPTVGVAPNTVDGGSVNMANTLSQGAWKAVQTYNDNQAAQGVTGLVNPYDQFAYQVTPGLVPMIGKFKAGQPLQVPTEVIEAARVAPPVYDTSAPDYLAMADEQTDPFFPDRSQKRYAAATDGFIQVQNSDGTYTGRVVSAQEARSLGFIENPTGVPPALQGRTVCVMQPTARECEEYLNQISANDLRLTQNVGLCNVKGKMIEFSSQILEGLVTLRKALALLRQGASALGASEAVTQSLQACDDMLLQMQRQIEQLTSDVVGLLSGRMDILTQRAEIVTTRRQALALEAGTRMSALVRRATFGG